MMLNTTLMLYDHFEQHNVGNSGWIDLPAVLDGPAVLGGSGKCVLTVDH